MKKIFAYFGILLSVVLMGAFTACTPKEIIDADAAGLGIKVFFPTKVVAGQPMTVNGTGFADVREVVFPNGVSVTDIEHVGNGMIRVTAPSGIAADGGKLIVRTGDDEAESSQTLTLGHTVVSGFSKQAGEEINGGETLSIYGEDLEFINGVELMDPDGNTYVLSDMDFYRKGTSEVKIIIPKKNLFDGAFVGKLFTYDGQEILLPELVYKPAKDEGHWETVETVLWENPGAGAVSWSGTYRFACEGHETGEEIYAFPADIWEKLKSETFYITVEATDPQIRVTTGWWSTTWTGGDFQPGNELLTDNGDGTWTLEVNLAGDPIVDAIDVEHLLFTGDRFTPVKIFMKEDVWIEGGGHMEIVKNSLWKNDGGPAVAWSGTYRFACEGHETGEEIYAFPADIWERLKSETFYITVEATDPQIRVTTGWWSTTWTGGDFQPGNELLTDNGDGTWTLEVNLAGDPIVDAIDVEHLLFTGDRFTPVEIFFQEEVWVGGDSGPKETLLWQNDGGPAVAWSGTYRFACEGHETGEEIYAFPADIWEKLKSETFYIMVEATDPQIRVTTGWWSTTWTGGDFQPGNERLTDNGDGTWTLEINLTGDPIVDSIDTEHLLFTGDRFTPVKIFFFK